jgi:Rad3-related DNA helicase
MVSRELEKECIVVFDEAHNIDNVCIEALSVSLRQQTLSAARGNISKLENVRGRRGAGGGLRSPPPRPAALSARHAHRRCTPAPHSLPPD